MNNKDINETMAAFCKAMDEREQMYIENEGEITDEVAKQEEWCEELKDLLCTEGIDSLGSWIAGLQDKVARYKAEKDYVARKIDAANKQIDYVKEQLNKVMTLVGLEKAKGSLGYSFTATMSETTSVDKDVLKDRYAALVEDAIRQAGIPAYVGVTLTASATAAKGCADVPEGLFQLNSRPSVRFVKPRTKGE